MSDTFHLKLYINWVRIHKRCIRKTDNKCIWTLSIKKSIGHTNSWTQKVVSRLNDKPLLEGSCFLQYGYLMYYTYLHMQVLQWQLVSSYFCVDIYQYSSQELVTISLGSREVTGKHKSSQVGGNIPMGRTIKSTWNGFVMLTYKGRHTL